MAQPIDFNIRNESTNYMCHQCGEIKKLNYYMGEKNNGEFSRIYGFCNKQCMLGSYFITHNLRTILNSENSQQQIEIFFKTYLFFKKKGKSQDKSYVEHKNIRIYEIIQNFKIRKDLDYFIITNLSAYCENNDPMDNFQLKWFMLINDQIKFCSTDGYIGRRTDQWNQVLWLQGI